MRLTSKGQITIPQGIREQLGLHPWTEVEFEVVGDSVCIKRKGGAKTRGELLLEAMSRAPRPIPGMTTDELMAFTRGE